MRISIRPGNCKSPLRCHCFPSLCRNNTMNSLCLELGIGQFDFGMDRWLPDTRIQPVAHISFRFHRKRVHRRMIFPQQHNRRYSRCCTQNTICKSSLVADKVPIRCTRIHYQRRRRARHLLKLAVISTTLRLNEFNGRVMRGEPLGFTNKLRICCRVLLLSSYVRQRGAINE